MRLEREREGEREREDCLPKGRTKPTIKATTWAFLRSSTPPVSAAQSTLGGSQML